MYGPIINSLSRLCRGPCDDAEPVTYPILARPNHTWMAMVAMYSWIDNAHAYGLELRRSGDAKSLYARDKHDLFPCFPNFHVKMPLHADF